MARDVARSAVSAWEEEVRIPVGGVHLSGTLELPAGAKALVIFAHGSGSGRFSTRNRRVAAHVRAGGLGTLLFDLLTRQEEADDAPTGHLRFDVAMLADRLADVAYWTRFCSRTRLLPRGYFGASTGAAAALIAAARHPGSIGAIVSRGGRPDLAGEALSRVAAPTLLIVGGADTPVIPLNQQAFDRLRCTKQIEIVPGASHLFEEAGALEIVARLATSWFETHLAFT